MQINNTPPVKLERDENGLLKHIQYVFTPEGYVDWKKMVPEKYLYPNPQKIQEIEKKYGKKIDEIPVSELEDRYKIITLNGIRYVLGLRGYTDVYFSANSSSPDYASVQCDIKFIPNYESEGFSVSFADQACAHQYNTQSFAQKYLIEIASNRAFCRAVRNFLKIDIVSKEELGGAGEMEEPESSLPDPYAMLKDLMSKRGTTFDTLKEKLVQKKFKGAETFEKLEDIPKLKVLEIISNIKKTKT